MSDPQEPTPIAELLRPFLALADTRAPILDWQFDGDKNQTMQDEGQRRLQALFDALADGTFEHARACSGPVPSETLPFDLLPLEELQRNAARAYRNYAALARGEGNSLLEVFADKLGWTLAQRAGAAVLWANKAAQLYAEARRMARIDPDPDPAQGDVP